VVARIAHRFEEARLAAQLVRTRLTLKRRLSGESLDTLIESLCSPASSAVALRLDRTLRVIRRTEAVLARCPGVPDTCLYRSVGRFAVLRSRGFAVEILMGLPENASDEHGHAWVTIDGAPFEDDDAEEASRMVVTFRFPPQESP